MYPSPERPNWGVFVRSQAESLAGHGVAGEVVEIEGWRTKANYLRALLTMRWRVGAQPYDLLHVHYGLTAMACIGVTAVPTVVSFCGDDVWGTPDRTGVRSRSSLWLARLGLLAARRADAVIVKSAEMARAIGPSYGLVEVIPNGVDLALFDPIPRDEARRRLGWPLDREILLFPANPAEPRKNFELAQAVETELIRQGRPVLLRWVYGRPQSEVALAMSAADILLNCSMQEGSPNAVKEAMAMGLPVVSTDVGDCAERLQGCSPGAVVPRQPSAFVSATTEVLNAARRSNGRSRIQALGLDAIAARVVAVYHRAIERFRTRREG
jgi:glycosyltransferase involved in cell wall biosynthesis